MSRPVGSRNGVRKGREPSQYDRHHPLSEEHKARISASLKAAYESGERVPSEYQKSRAAWAAHIRPREPATEESREKMRAFWRQWRKEHGKEEGNE